MKIFELRKKISEKKSEMRKLVEGAEKEDRDMTPDESGKYDQLRADVDSLNTRVAKLEETEAGEDGAEGDDKPEPRSKSIRFERRSVRPSEAPAVHTREHTYSVLRAIEMMSDRKNPRLDGLEKEWSREIEIRTGKTAQGFFVPHHFANPKAMEARNLTLSTGAGFIPTITEPTVIDYLYARTMVIKAGAMVISDMTNKFALPRLSSTTSAYWIAEGAAPTASAPAIDQVSFTPQTVGAYTDISRKTLMQASVDAEMVVRGDLARQVALAIDYASINGSGTSNQPLGLMQNTNVPTVSLGANSGAPTWKFSVDLETKVSIANADLGKLAYMSSAAGRGTLKTTVKNAGTGYPIYLCENGEVNGYALHTTNQVPTGLTVGSATTCTGLIFGNWADLVIALFGALDVLVDPYTGSNTGNVRVNIFQDADIHNRHDNSFAVGLFVVS